MIMRFSLLELLPLPPADWYQVYKSNGKGKGFRYIYLPLVNKQQMLI